MSDETIRHIATVLPIDPEVLKPKRKFQRSGSIVKEFGLNTSTHGIPGIARSRSIQNRTFWSISLLIFTGVMLYFVIESLSAFFHYPTQTSVSVVVEWPQAFPAVTICNYSPLRYDQFIGPFLNYTNALNLTNTTDTTTFTPTQASYIQNFLLYKFNRGESMNDFLFSLSSMMMGCVYNGLPCSEANFTSFISPLYGLCYTFNAKLNNATNNGIRPTSENGVNGLFELQLYAHRQQYVPYMLKGIGMMVMVHDNAELPTIELAGMQLAPGRHHRLSYTKRTNLFLPSPYTSCNSKNNLGMQAMYDQFYGTNYGYSQFNCYEVCIQTYTYQKCDCGSPLRWSIRSVALPGTNNIVNISLCDYINSCYTGVAAEVMSTPSIWTVYCSDCTQECSTVGFTIKSSSLAAPPDFLLSDIKQFVEWSNVSLSANWSTSWSSEIPASYVALEVAYETTQSEIYSQEATLGATDVVSNVGGQTGLWIGISFLSLMEIAEMIYRLTRTQCYRLRKIIRKKFRKQKMNKQSSNDG